MAGAAPDGPVVVKPITAGATHPLRQKVLRPHQRVDEVGFAGDDDPQSLHLGAFDAASRLVGTGSLVRQPPPWAPQDASAWRLRGMATEQARRGNGVGAAVISAAIHHVAAMGGGRLWCNARVPAVGFYRRVGMYPVGEQWDEPDIGPHIAMELWVEAGP